MNRFGVVRWAASAAALLFAAGVATAGDDPGEDAAALLRRARTVETVEHDARKAMDLYRAAVDAGGSPDASRDAALRLADLLELRGERADALRTFGVITRRFATRLDDDQKRRVHEATARLLPPGGHAVTPLGDVWVRGAPGGTTDAVAGASPLESKVLGLLARLDATTASDRAGVEAQVSQALDLVGKDALPALEREMNTGRLDKAQFAAREYARLGGAAAVPGLERALREGDGFARGAALDAMVGHLRNTEEVSAVLVPAVDRLLDAPGLAERRPWLVKILERLTTEQLLSRQALGGPDADAFLRMAIRRKSSVAFERGLAIAQTGAEGASDLVNALARVAGGDRASIWSTDGRRPLEPLMPALTDDQRLTVLRLVARGPVTERAASAIADIVGAIETSGDARAFSTATLEAWAFALGAADLDRRLEACRALLQHGVTPTIEVLENPRTREAYAASLGALLRGLAPPQNSPKGLLSPSLYASKAFWDALFVALSALSPEQRIATMGHVELGQATVLPQEIARRWIDVIADLGDLPPPGDVLFAAARSGDPRFLELVRREVLERPSANPRAEKRRSQLVHALPWFEGPGRLRLALDLLESDGGAPTYERWLPTVLQAESDAPEFWSDIQAEFLRLGADRVGILLSALSGLRWIDSLRAAKRHDAGWIPVLSRFAELTVPANSTEVREFSRAAARSGDPSFLALLRAETIAKPATSLVGRKLLEAFSAYDGPDRLAFVMDAFERHGDQAVLQRALEEELAGSGARDRLVALARDADAAASRFAIGRLVETQDRTVLLGAMEAQRTATQPGAQEHRKALIAAAVRLHMKEAVPFLLHEFQGTLSREAADAMDAIRAYHERLERYSAWTKGEESGPSALATLLKDADPEIRRAAVLSIGALGDTDALPVLVRMAKEERDPSVRKAALDAVERLSKSARTPPPGSPVPEPAAMEGE